MKIMYSQATDLATSSVHNINDNYYLIKVGMAQWLTRCLRLVILMPWVQAQVTYKLYFRDTHLLIRG